MKKINAPKSLSLETVASKDWWENYFTTGKIMGTKPNHFLVSQKDFLLQILKENPKATAFAVSDGQGRNGVYLSKLGFTVTASDISENAVRDAKAFAKQEQVEDRYFPKQQDGTTADFGENLYDLIVVIFSQFTVDHEGFHKRLIKALKKGGYILVVGWTYDHYYKAFQEKLDKSLLKLMYSLEEMKKGFVGLEIVHAKEYAEECIELQNKVSYFATVIAKK